MGSGDRSRMVAACRTALTRAGGEGPTGGGDWRDSEYADGRDTRVPGRREGLRFHRRGTGVSKEVEKGGGGGVLDMGKRWAEARVSKTRCLGS